MRIAMVVPTYNEAENVPVLAKALLALTPPVDMVVVDDASPDGTGEIADAIAEKEPRFRVIHRTGKRGYSAACKEGLAYCIDEGYDVVGTIDADISQPPSVLPRMVATLEQGADVAIGSRYTPGGSLEVDWGPVRRAVSQAGSAYARLMVGTHVRDCTTGYRLYRAETLSAVPFAQIRSEGYSFLIEVLAGLTDVGATIVEVPITYVDRERGASKISRSIIFEALWRSTLVGLGRLTGSRRRAARAAAAE